MENISNVKKLLWFFAFDIASTEHCVPNEFHFDAFVDTWGDDNAAGTVFVDDFNDDRLLGASSIDAFCDKAEGKCQKLKCKFILCIWEKRRGRFCYKICLSTMLPLFVRRLLDLAGGMQYSLCNAFRRSLKNVSMPCQAFFSMNPFTTPQTFLVYFISEYTDSMVWSSTVLYNAVKLKILAFGERF